MGISTCNTLREEQLCVIAEKIGEMKINKRIELPDDYSGKPEKLYSLCHMVLHKASKGDIDENQLTEFTDRLVYEEFGVEALIKGEGNPYEGTDPEGYAKHYGFGYSQELAGSEILKSERQEQYSSLNQLVFNAIDYMFCNTEAEWEGRVEFFLKPVRDKNSPLLFNLEVEIDTVRTDVCTYLVQHRDVICVGDSTDAIMTMIDSE